MSGNVDGLVAVVTGGASGIGRATAIALAAAGAAAVVIADLHREPREGGTPTDELLGCPATFVRCDVSKLDELETAIAAADAHGGVDVMANVAGVMVTRRFLDVTEAEFDLQMNVNAKGTFFGTQIAARRMIAKGGGSIVNVSSVAGLGGSAIAPAYSASKGAVRLLTYAAAQAVGRHGVRVNAVHPGMVTTEMTREDIGLTDEAAASPHIPLGRAATPEDVAAAIVYLAGPQSQYISGTSLLVDGGYFNTLH